MYMSWTCMRQVTLAAASLSFVLTFLARSALLILSFCALTFCIVGGGMCSSSNRKQLSIARSHSASRTVVVVSHENESTIRFQCVIVLTAIAQTAVRSKDITQIFILAEMGPQYQYYPRTARYGLSFPGSHFATLVRKMGENPVLS